MVELNSGHALYSIQFRPDVSSAAAKDICANAAREFNSTDARASHSNDIIIVNLLFDGYNRVITLIIGLYSSKNNAPADESSDTHLKDTSMRVLIIDDDETMREAIGYILEDLGIEFDAVSSGEEGLARLVEQYYHLVFLDLVLHTGSHGIEIFRRLCRCSDNLCIVLMTASGSREPIFEEATKLQRPILRKPFSLDEIQRIIEKLKKAGVKYGN